MKHEFLRKYLTNPRDFERWLKANVLVGSLVAVPSADQTCTFWPVVAQR
jgi:hypothetical protein